MGLGHLREGELICRAPSRDAWLRGIPPVRRCARRDAERSDDPHRGGAQLPDGGRDYFDREGSTQRVLQPRRADCSPRRIGKAGWFFTPPRASVSRHLDTDVCPWTVSFRPDGKKLAVACWGQQVQIWDLQTFELDDRCLEFRTVVWGVAFKPDEPEIFAACSDDGSIRLWDLERQSNLLQLEPFGNHAASAVAFTPDGKTLVASGSDGSILVWDLEYYQRPHRGPREVLHGVDAAQAG